MAKNHRYFVVPASSPKTPSNAAVVSASPLHVTPVEQYSETEREPDRPRKEHSIKKKTINHISKRKLVLQGGSSIKVNKGKRHTTSSQPKNTFLHKKGPISPPCQAEGTKLNFPLTERQQLQYLLEVTAKEANCVSGTDFSDDGRLNTNSAKKKEHSGESHADIRIRKRNERGETALHLAAIKGDLEDVVTLLQAGALVNAKDNAGWTALHEACNYGNLSIVQELVWSGADVNCPGYEAITPLHDAVINNHAKVVQFLLDNGADPSLKTSQNYSAVDLATCAATLNLLRPDLKREEISCPQESFSVVMPPFFSQPQPCGSYFYSTEQNINGTGHDVVIKERLHNVPVAEKPLLIRAAHKTSQEMDSKANVWINRDGAVDSHKTRKVEVLRAQRSTVFHEYCSVFPTDAQEIGAKAPLTTLTQTEIAPKDSGTHDHKVCSPRFGSESTKPLLTEASGACHVNGVKKSPTKNCTLTSSLQKDDTDLPEKLNECLDKALIEISSYLESSQNVEMPSNETMSIMSKEEAGVSSRVGIQEKESIDLKIADTSQKAYRPKNDASPERNLFAENSLPLTMECKAEDSTEDVVDQADSNFTKIKAKNEKKKTNNDFQIDRSSKIGKRKKLPAETTEYMKSESSIKEECVNHISNRTWRSSLPKYRYSVSSLQFRVPGYEDFLINSKSYSLGGSGPPYQNCCGDENQLKKLQSQHDTEKVKLRMTLEQELVRVFGNRVRRSVGYIVPYGACTVIGSQMKHLQETEIIQSKPEEHVSIKLEVDKILTKFSKLKVRMLTRQKHEMEAALALERLWTNDSGKEFNGTRGHHPARSGIETYVNSSADFELLPCKFAEYYEDVLCATD